MGGLHRQPDRGAGADGSRRHNLSAVLAHVHLSGSASRTQLARVTGLNRSTVADLIAQLVESDLVTEERAAVAAGPGRPSPLVRPRPDGAVVLGIELAVDSIAVATVGLGGHVFNRVRIDRPRGRFSPDQTVEDAVTLSGPLLAALPTTHRFAGVGAAVVGVTRTADGFVHLAPNLGWRDVPLGEMLAERLDAGPVWVANEADLAALCEHRRGSRAKTSNLLFVSGEVGIGVGIILEGESRRGAAGYAGEAGHTLVNPAGIRCRCGATGCWETEAGEAALLRHAGVSAGDGGRAAIDRVLALAVDGDPKATSALSTVGWWLGLGIGDLVNLLNPEVVVIGGMYERLFRHLEQSIREGVAARVLAAPGAMVEILPTSIGIDAPLLGAAELALTDVIKHPNRTSTTRSRV
jgi:predicted NBD/HSP70 family sugar kinase